MKTVRHLGRGAFGQVRLCLTEPGDQFSNAASLPSDASSQPDQNLAFQPALVAVKLVDLSGLSRQLRKRALKEAKLLQKLSRHPNIIECFDVLFGEKDVLQIVLEFAPCGDLHQHCEKNGRCGEKKALGWGGQILSALAYCHAKKILHRDLKPANILLFGGGRAKLADFGVCFVGDSAAASARTGATNSVHSGQYGGGTVRSNARDKTTVRAKTVIGTPHYFAPELVNGEEYGPASDVWSFGVCLYESVAFPLRPFTGNNLAALALKISKADWQPLPPDLNYEIANVKTLLEEKLLVEAPKARMRAARAVQEIERIFRDVHGIAASQEVKLGVVEPVSSSLLGPKMLQEDEGLAGGRTATADDRSRPPVPPSESEAEVTASSASVPPGRPSALQKYSFLEPSLYADLCDWEELEAIGDHDQENLSGSDEESWGDAEEIIGDRAGEGDEDFLKDEDGGQTTLNDAELIPPADTPGSVCDEDAAVSTLQEPVPPELQKRTSSRGGNFAERLRKLSDDARSLQDMIDGQQDSSAAADATDAVSDDEDPNMKTEKLPLPHSERSEDRPITFAVTESSNQSDTLCYSPDPSTLIAEHPSSTSNCGSSVAVPPTFAADEDDKERHDRMQPLPQLELPFPLIPSTGSSSSNKPSSRGRGATAGGSSSSSSSRPNSRPELPEVIVQRRKTPPIIGSRGSQGSTPRLSCRNGSTPASGGATPRLSRQGSTPATPRVLGELVVDAKRQREQIINSNLGGGLGRLDFPAPEGRAKQFSSAAGTSYLASHLARRKTREAGGSAVSTEELERKRQLNAASQADFELLKASMSTGGKKEKQASTRAGSTVSGTSTASSSTHRSVGATATSNGICITTGTTTSSYSGNRRLPRRRVMSEAVLPQADARGTKVAGRSGPAKPSAASPRIASNRLTFVDKIRYQSSASTTATDTANRAAVAADHSQQPLFLNSGKLHGMAAKKKNVLFHDGKNFYRMLNQDASSHDHAEQVDVPQHQELQRHADAPGRGGGHYAHEDAQNSVFQVRIRDDDETDAAPMLKFHSAHSTKKENSTGSATSHYKSIVPPGATGPLVTHDVDGNEDADNSNKSLSSTQRISIPDEDFAEFGQKSRTREFYLTKSAWTEDEFSASLKYRTSSEDAGETTDPEIEIDVDGGDAAMGAGAGGGTTTSSQRSSRSRPHLEIIPPDADEFLGNRVTPHFAAAGRACDGDLAGLAETREESRRIMGKNRSANSSRQSGLESLSGDDDEYEDILNGPFGGTIGKTADDDDATSHFQLVFERKTPSNMSNFSTSPSKNCPSSGRGAGSSRSAGPTPKPVTKQKPAFLQRAGEAPVSNNDRAPEEEDCRGGGASSEYSDDFEEDNDLPEESEDENEEGHQEQQGEFVQLQCRNAVDLKLNSPSMCVVFSVVDRVKNPFSDENNIFALTSVPETTVMLGGEGEQK
eukprot:CAMPEP_0178982728 /NCGR_PEP_ID=MMETSP0795-20121207/663_1 /TAXON_ID=88552 /ORGANISM="Amoebophrya sp., Strain Ameob2" /LENGTH=1443 /DNA_ID=CAMNT_0020673417 /DNA_START=45 /DNA_END=4376 /DNA_ORIENTATION=-